MRPTTSTGRVLPGLLAAVVVSIVLGIIGMHALFTHGVVSDVSYSDHVTDPVAAGEGEGEGDGHDMRGMRGMVMLCAAMLAATAAAVLLLTLGLRRAPRLWALLPSPATTTRWVASGLGTGPPPAWEFSVIRC